MKLSLEVVLVVAVAAILPSIVVGVLAVQTIEGETREGYERSLRVTVEAVRRRVDERLTSDQRALGRLCQHDFVVDRALLDLQAGRFGPDSQQRLVADLPPIMESLGLDTLELLDMRPSERGRILAAAHFPGEAGGQDARLARAVTSARGRPFVHAMRMRERGGGLSDARTLLTACMAGRGGVRLAVVGGRLLDARFAESLGSPSNNVRLVLTDAGGRVPSGVPAGGGRQTVRSFASEGGEPMARLVAAVDDSSLSSQVALLQRRIIYGCAGGAALALVVGLLLSLSLIGPLRDLKLASQRVAAGDLESTISVRSRGEVGEALEAFNTMTRKLRRTQKKLLQAERIAAWRDIARRIAHEIKNPLSPIQVSIETMRKTHARQHPDFDEIFEESTVMILEEVERLKRIVTEFSEFARMPRPNARPLDVLVVLGHVVELHRGGEVEIEVQAAEGLPSILADREQITQVLVNLVQNAAGAAAAARVGDAGHVRIVVERSSDGQGIEIRVQDDGPGIPEEQRGHVFEPYYTTKVGGTGLGLAIVHKIVADHGGSVEVGRSPLGGAELVVTLTEAGPPLDATASVTDTASPLV